jgi:DNA-binding TFAR19-related protein (PDSD5 family)
MACSGTLRRVALVRSDVSEELSASFIRVTRIGELGTTLALTINRLRNVVLTRATRCNIPEDAILHIHRRENLKSYIGHV